MTATAPVAVVVGGTSGIGRAVAAHLAGRGEQVVLTGRSSDRAVDVACGIGGATRGIGLDLTHPEQVCASFDGIGHIDHLVLAAIDRDANTVRDYDIASALKLVTLKLIGYTATVHALASRMVPDAGVVLLGGLAHARPYPGSTTVTTVNGAVSAMVRTLAVELAPVRVNAVHPAAVADTPFWRERAGALEQFRARTPSGRLVETADVVHAVTFLLDNRGMNGVGLDIDGGTMLV